MGRVRPRVWVWVATEKAVLTVTQFGMRGEQNVERDEV